MKVELGVDAKDRSFSQADFLEVHESSKDPNRHYRWVRVDETMTSHTKAQIDGYTPVMKGEVKTVSEPLEKGGEQIIVGDLMLMSCPKEDYERRQKERADRTQALIHSTTAEAERRAQEKKIKLIKDADHHKE